MDQALIVLTADEYGEKSGSSIYIHSLQKGEPLLVPNAYDQYDNWCLSFNKKGIHCCKLFDSVEFRFSSYNFRYNNSFIYAWNKLMGNQVLNDCVMIPFPKTYINARAGQSIVLDGGNSKDWYRLMLKKMLPPVCSRVIKYMDNTMTIDLSYKGTFHPVSKRLSRQNVREKATFYEYRKTIIKKNCSKYTLNLSHATSKIIKIRAL